MTLIELLTRLEKSDASDLHICVGSPPVVRRFGRLEPLEEGRPPLTPRDVEEMVFQFLTQEQQARLQEKNEIDMSASLPGVGRFRVNLHRQRGTWAGVFRKIPQEVPTAAGLGLPPTVLHLAEKPSGLVLVTGSTSSGKTTTLSAMIEHINNTRPCHIITIEDPVEYIHKNKKAIIKQREVGSDTAGFKEALRHIFRQDPDVIMIGEMRDTDTIATAVSAAATGRLVLATLNTTEAAGTLDQLIEVFPPDQQGVIRTQLAGCLEGVVCQALLVGENGTRRIPALEILLATPSIRNLIRMGKTTQIQTDIEVGRRFGMQTLNQALQKLVTDGSVKLDEALRHSRHPADLLQKLGVPQPV
jgi:twitching motility protein PilT